MPFQLLMGAEPALVHLIDDTVFALYEALTLFAAKIRRGILSNLVSRDRTTRDELAQSLANNDAVPTDDRERLEIVLHHYHLPKLADEHFVEYDPRTGDVVRSRDADAIQSVINTQ